MVDAAIFLGHSSTAGAVSHCDAVESVKNPSHSDFTRRGYPPSSSSVASNTEKCRASCGRPLRRRYSKEYRNHKNTAKNCYIPALICLMVAARFELRPTIQFLDAFRMVRYSATRFSTGAQSNGNKYCDILFGTQNDNDIQQPKATPKDPFAATGTDDDLFTTLAGGPNLIFEMARKSMLFATKETDTAQSSNTTATTLVASSEQSRPPPPTQGRWYPHSGIAETNPNFRTQAPVMTNKGFAKSIWKNVRKRNKPSLWKYALRTYDRMALLEGDPNFEQIKRSNIHHEGAMQACAKLGLWQRALEIYHFVYEQERGEERQSQKTSPPGSSLTPQERKAKRDEKDAGIYVTDDMVLSLVRSTVRASRLRSRQKRKSDDPPLTPEQEEQEAALRRIPLDTALEILSTMPEDHDIPLVAYYLNPVAAAYQSLGYTAFSKEMLETMLSNRTAGEDDILNVHDLCAKDKGSYSLLVQASVVTGDWGAAMDSLSDMTNAGIYPNSRHCNVWSEISERQTRPRAVGSWKKKRDDYWTDSVR